MDTNIKNFTDQANSWYHKNIKKIWITTGAALLISGGSLIYVQHGKDKPLPPMRSTKEIVTEIKYILDDHVVDSLKKVIAKKEDDRIAAVKSFNSEKIINRFLRSKVDEVRNDTEQTQYVHDLVNSSASLDTSCDAMATAYQQEIFTKDSTIVRLESNIGKISDKSTELAINNDIKDQAIKNLNKSLRKQKLKSYGLAAITGLAIIKLLTK